MTDHTTAERAKFEAAYRAKFETAAALQPGIFEIDEFGDYLLAKVFVAFEMWKIGRSTLPMASPTTPDAVLISRVFEQFRHDACLAGDDRISESFIKAAGDLMAARVVPVSNKLSVWSGSMPESNGKSNFTAILHCGDLSKGHTIDRSEYPDRVRYEADRVRWLLGEIDKEPFVLDYDADKHSGYAAQSEPATRAVPVAMSDEKILALSLKHIPPYESTDEQVVRFARALLAAILSDSAAPTPDAERHVANHAGDFHAALVLEMSELCDRNSPEDEPDAMIANSDEMEGCIERALERTGLRLRADGDAVPMAIPEGYVLMPLRLTAENGAKGLLSGAFAEHVEISNPDYDSDDADSDEPETHRVDVPVEWATIKRIYAMAVEHLAAPAQPTDSTA